jgi:hypothetical protein
VPTKNRFVPAWQGVYAVPACSRACSCSRSRSIRSIPSLRYQRNAERKSMARYKRCEESSRSVKRWRTNSAPSRSVGAPRHLQHSVRKRLARGAAGARSR